MKGRQNKRINDFEKNYIYQIKHRLNEKLEESGIRKADLYVKTQEMGFSFSDKALYNAFNYSETSLNSLVLIAICQVLHISASWLLAEPDDAFLPPDCINPCKSGNNMYTILTDPHYMQTYYCYTYKPTYKRLYLHCELTMEKTGEDKAIAVLKICDLYSRQGNAEKFTNIFTGVPVWCKAEEVVYIVFTNDFGYMNFLCFDYVKYKRTDMYFRIGLFVTVNPVTKTPQFQKIILSLREYEAEELPYVEGLLRASSDEIILTEESMEELFEEYADQKTMQQFRKDFMPLFRLLEHKCYIINEKEIISYSASRLNEQERMKAIMLLKKKSRQPVDVNVKADEALPRLMKDGLLRKEENN